MKNSTKRLSFLLEIGTEELPPKELLSLRNNLHDSLINLLQKSMSEAGLCAPSDISASNNIECYASPRRLAVVAKLLTLNSPETVAVRRITGPNITAAFDAHSKPTKAALGFARKYNLEMSENLDDLPKLTPADEASWAKTHKPKSNGEDITLLCRDEEKLLIILSAAQPSLNALLLSAVQQACKDLPCERSMRWGSNKTQFVRPVRWVTLLCNMHENQSIAKHVPGEVLGVATTDCSRGHPFMRGRTKLRFDIETYEEYLRDLSVLASLEKRETLIKKEATKLAVSIGGHVHIEKTLCEEVSALTEWPVVLHGQFDKRYLELPESLLISVLQKHQRYFPVYTKQKKKLLNAFIFVANIEGNAAGIIHGNERVLRPRLEDAEFFYRQDSQLTLEQLAVGLKKRTFQNELGKNQNSMWHKMERVQKIAGLIAECLQVPPDWNKDDMERAALLCKADLQSAVVTEFPELQGVMGEHYASIQGESSTVSKAIAEHYLPQTAGDNLPQSALGEALAVADRMDALFALIDKGKQPTGSKDPLGLRRAALGVHRILTEGKYLQTLSLKDLIAKIAATQYNDNQILAEQIFHFMFERFKVWLRQSFDLPASMVEAVCSHLSEYQNPQPFRSYDCLHRLEQMRVFSHKEVFGDLVSLHKRLRNILYQEKSASIKSKHTTTNANFKTLNPKHFKHDVETALFKSLTDNEKAIGDMRAHQNVDYGAMLEILANLAKPVEAFFNEVMVMDKNKALRENRLALLHQLECHLLKIANFSVINIKERTII